jgi:hypothetical protein
MKNIQEGGKCVASNLTNLGLVHESLVEEVCSILLLAVAVLGTGDILSILVFLLLGRHAGDVESHFHQLVPCTGRFLASEFGSPKVSVCAGIAISGKREINSDLVLASQVGVGDFGVGHFEGGAVGDIEGEFGLAKIGLAPVPAAQGMLAIVQADAVPRLEDLGNAVEVVLFEAVELDDAVVAREDLDFVAPCCPTPLGRDDL